MLIVIASIIVHSAALRSEETGQPWTYPLRSDIYTYRFVSETDDVSALFVNPAGLAMRPYSSMLLRGAYSYDRMREVTAGLAFPHIGMGYSRLDNGLFKSSSLSLGLAIPVGERFTIGSSMAWNKSDIDLDGSPFSAGLGFMIRPSRRFSLGGVWNDMNRPGFGGEPIEDRFTLALSLRPFDERLTMSFQADLNDGLKPGYLMGGSLAIIPGIEIYGTYARDLSRPGDDPYEEFSAGLAFAFDYGRVRTATRMLPDGDRDYSVNSISIERSKAYRKDTLVRKDLFARVEVSGEYLDEGGRFQLVGSKNNNLHTLLRELRNIRDDEDINGLLLSVGNLGGGFIGPVSGNLYEIRQAISQVRSAGKPVVAYLTSGGGASELYLASAADRIVSPQLGTVGNIGVSLEVKRLKNLFNKFGIEWDHSTAGEYKSSFHTQYTDTSTVAQAAEIQGLVNESYRLLTAAIAEGRGISGEKMGRLAQGQIFSPEEAVDEGLIDRVGWKAEAVEELGKLAGRKDPESTPTTDVSGRIYWDDRWAPPPAVAIVGAYGSIEPGKNSLDPIRGSRKMGSSSIVHSLRKASNWPGVRAIVFRVDSGGGSALASDAILEEIRDIQEKRKIPVLISMSNIAGSGGYWISMYGDAIYADPFTITGSIGVVSAKPVLQGLYEKAGINNETFKSGEYSDAFSSARHATEEESVMVEKRISNIYEIFITKVSEGRKIEKEEVYPLAGGRLYLGSQALEAGLVDKLGGLWDAVEAAASMAGIDNDYTTLYFRAFRGFFFNSREISPLGILKAARGFWPSGDSDFDRTISGEDIE